MADLTAFKDYLIINGSAEESVNTHIMKIKSFLLQYDVLTQENLNSFLANKLKTCNANSINIFLNSLKHYANFSKIQLEFPMYHKVNQSVKEYITEKELEEILVQLPMVFEKDYKKIKVILLLMFESGIRPKELKNLKREDFNLNEKHFFIKNTKVSRDKKIVLSDHLCKLLPDVFQQEAEKINCFNIYRDSLGYMFRTIRKNLGFKKTLTPYTMRVSFAHNMLSKGLKITSLQRGMNHKNIQTTLGYLQVNDEDANEEIKSILNKKRRR